MTTKSKQKHIRILVSSAAAMLRLCDDCPATIEARCVLPNGQAYSAIVHASRRAKVSIIHPGKYVNWPINEAAEKNTQWAVKNATKKVSRLKAVQ